MAHKTGAVGRQGSAAAVDATVQPKAVAHPIDAKFVHRALDKMVNQNGVKLRQTCLRVAKRAANMVERYTHADQIKRVRKMLELLRALLVRVSRDINRKIDGNAFLQGRFRRLPILAGHVRLQDHRQRARKSNHCVPRRSNASARARPAPRIGSHTLETRAEREHLGRWAAEALDVSLERGVVETEFQAVGLWFCIHSFKRAPAPRCNGQVRET